MSLHEPAIHFRLKGPFVTSFIDQAMVAYYQYEVTFALYVMTPAEKLAFNSLVVLMLSLVTLPALMYLFWLLAQVSRYIHSYSSMFPSMISYLFEAIKVQYMVGSIIDWFSKYG